MKNLKVLLQESILIFVMLFMAACESDQDTLAPSAPSGDEIATVPNQVKYLTLFDALGMNAIVIKIKVANRELWNSLTEETLELVALEKKLPETVDYEAAKFHFLDIRASLSPVEIEVMETKLQKNIRFYGIKFANTGLIRNDGVKAFTYKNHNVRAVYATGLNISKQIYGFRVQAKDCPDCKAEELYPSYSASSNMIRFAQEERSDVTLTVHKKFSDDIVILW